MKSDHPVDADIQQYTLLSEECAAEIVIHIDRCPTCKWRAEQYKLLFSGIEAQHMPAFDFDLTQAVMTQLPQRKDTRAQLFPIAIVLIIAGIGCPIFYFFGHTFLQILSNVKGILSGIIFLTAIILVAFLYVDQMSNYKNRMRKLNLS